MSHYEVIFSALLLRADLHRHVDTTTGSPNAALGSHQPACADQLRLDLSCIQASATDQLVAALSSSNGPGVI